MIYPNIKAEMGRKNITIKKLANILGLSTNSVGYKLSGKREFTLSEIENIANIFGCSLDYLVEHEFKGQGVSIPTQRKRYVNRMGKFTSEDGRGVI